jgi:uncharacterized membrane protein YfcA
VPFLDIIDPLFAVSGFTVGFIVGLTGVGGGSLMTPLLILLFGVHPATAVGTDLLYAGLTKAVGTTVHGRSGSVNWRIVSLLASGSIPASVATLVALHVLGPRTEATSVLISFVLGMALLTTAASLALRNRLIGLSATANGADIASTNIASEWRAALTVLVGGAVGVLISISSVGAGAIGVTALYFLYPRLPAKMLVGSDIAHAVPLTLVAGSGYWLLGSIDWGMLGSLLVGSVPGIIVGSASAPRIPDAVLRPILATVLALVGARLVFV